MMMTVIVVAAAVRDNQNIDNDTDQTKPCCEGFSLIPAWDNYLKIFIG